ncbi:epimerase family protein SDR39U1 homolog, chloroplastic isoform X6 [Malania oleifera]|uniref:epimerase family protein SDR39U1 homolog, chloroplastic isoform X6 n=1 Tax=Malania oleifera TaxID=397392 RepID=UPI0025AEAF5F|nr:epimerase family protein SDR39U1 homolog, chloroplastic isoform X6 [Malania oleifera]
MELYSRAFSPSSLHIPKPSSVCGTEKRFRVWCLNNGSNKKNASDQSEKENQMIIAITGATGFIGRRLVQRLYADKHCVRVLTRSRYNAQLIFPAKDFPGIVIAEEPEWKDCIHGSDAVVNLAGVPISTRWSSEIKKEIKESRIRVTSKVVGLINGAQDELRPTVMVSATAVGYYAKMIPLFMMFAGGPLGTGRQWFSWIHLDDIVNLIYEALSNSSYQGVINGTAPNPVRLAEMCNHLGNVLGRPSWLPVPDFAIKAVLGEGASVVLEGQRVVPARAKELGFLFKYPYVKDALEAIL